MTQLPLKDSSPSGEHQVRSSVRFPLRLPVILETNIGDLQAVTEDISASGALFAVRTGTIPADPVRWRYTLPAALMGTPEDVTVACTGRIVRREQGATGLLLGVELDEYSLEQHRKGDAA